LFVRIAVANPDTNVRKSSGTIAWKPRILIPMTAIQRVRVIETALIIAASCTFPGGQQKTTVVFVCEHGAARSVIAAAYFNKLAAERHLPYRAIARGTSPQENLSAAAVRGLEQDRVDFERESPKLLTEADMKDAVRIVAFCPIPDAFSRAIPVDEHDDVPDVGKSYAGARDRLLVYIKELLEELGR
jgi:protein-tyrosine-phosphatase